MGYHNRVHSRIYSYLELFQVSWHQVLFAVDENAGKEELIG